jgi:hypothetical protein
MLPSAAGLKTTSVPGSIPKWSRTRFGTVTRPLLVTFVGTAFSKIGPSGRSSEKLAKSSLASMVNRVLTSPYLWWFDPFEAGLTLAIGGPTVLAL